MTKPKFDLSNVGGQPKDWAQRQNERDIEGGLGFKVYALIATFVVSLLATGYGLLKLLFWLLGKS